MKLRAKMLARFAVAAALLVFSGLLTLVIKDTLAARNPESVLPVIIVRYNGRGLPPENVMMDAYSWTFLNKKKTWSETELDWRKMPSALVMPSEPLTIDFSFGCDTLSVSRATEGSEQFEEVRGSGSPGELQTPATTGEYTYRVEAKWGTRGTVWFYFKLFVVDFTKNGPGGVPSARIGTSQVVG